MAHRHTPRVIVWLTLGVLCVYFLLVSFRQLTVVPPVFEDEPWFASIAYKWATDGVFGSDVFQGYHGLERRYYAIMPIAPMLLTGVFKLFGFGLLELRLESVALGAITLALTYALGRRLFGSVVGVVAVAFLLLVRMDAVGRFWPTGILFLDVPRIGRYDMPVPVFGLLALLAYLAARDRSYDDTWPWLLYGLAGALAGLSGLSHLYGVFWIVVLAVLAIWDHAERRSIVALGVGFLLPWVPYGFYVASDVDAWVGQTQGWGPRFGLAHARWYVRNVLTEPYRYAPGLGRPSLSWLLRPGLWAGLLLIGGSCIWLVRRATRDINARALVVPAVLMPVLFALLITHKFRNYKVAFLPLLAIAAAWGVCELWQAAGRHANGRWLRSAIVILATLVAFEGVARVAALERVAAATSPYATYIARVHAHVAPGTRVLGLHNYWLGFEDTDYRSWWVPLALIDARVYSQPPTVQEVMREIDPQVVLLDRRIREYLATSIDPSDLRREAVTRWLSGWTLTAVVDDSTYGRMDIYRPGAVRQPP